MKQYTRSSEEHFPTQQSKWIEKWPCPTHSATSTHHFVPFSASSIQQSYFFVTVSPVPLVETSASTTLSVFKTSSRRPLLDHTASRIAASSSKSILKTKTPISHPTSSTTSPTELSVSEANTTHGEPSILLNNLSRDGKIGVAIGVPMIFIAIVALTILACIRLQHRNRSQASKFPKTNLEHETSTLVAQALNAAQTRNSIDSMTSLDSAGIRWPERVILTGDAKEFHKLTRYCGQQRASNMRAVVRNKTQEEIERQLRLIGSANFHHENSRQ